MTDLARHPRQRVAGAAAVLMWAIVAALVAVVLAQLGSAAVYAVGGLIGVGVIGYALRDELRGPVVSGLRRIVPAHPDERPGHGAARTGVPVVLVGVGSAALAWALARQGVKGVIALVAVVAVGGLLAVMWPLVVDLVRGPVDGSGAGPVRTATATGRPVPTTARRADGGAAPAPARSSGVLGVVVVGCAAAGIAWIAASLGMKGLIAVVGGIVAVGAFTLVRDRTAFITFATVCSLTFVMHKSFGPQDLQLSGGAISVYLTTFDVMLVLLYGLWLREGTLVSDVRAAMREPVIWLPLVAALLYLPSLLMAPTPLLSAAELVRMGWMYLLFLYVAVRVRTRRHVWVVLGGLVVFAAVELAVVVLQWRTGGVLGLSFLGVPTELGDRVTDTEVLGRPFGTIIHPVFMAAALGMVAMVALAFAVQLQRSLTKVVAVVVFLGCLACMWISDTRASFVAALMVGVVVVGVGIARRRIAWVTLRRIGIGAVVIGLVFFSQISDKFVNSFRTGHFLTEIESRFELNDIAGRMISDHVVLGVGLNNFEAVLPGYEANPVIFFGHPVHNLYLLVLAETGVVGFVGLLLVGVGLYDVAIRLARSKDRLLGTLGTGVAAAMAFVMVEELLGFSLRQDIPLALYWLFAGLAVAGARMSGMRWPALRAGADRSLPIAEGQRHGC